MDKEQEFTVKQVRLRVLDDIECAIGAGNYNEARDRLVMFMHTVKENSAPAVQMYSAVNKLKEQFNVDCDSVIAAASSAEKISFGGDDPCKGLPPLQWQEEKLEELRVKLLMDCHKVCWDIALRFNLIPSE